MCGIAGIAGEPSGPFIRAMTRALVHRGPDGEGYYSARGVTLGHRRLSVIDLETGSQPMTTADGRYTIAFNGEIYNFQELRKELESHGVRFRTKSDTEALLHAYARWGKSSLTKLVGMFAFALWDSKDRRLLLARDRLGLKPLYYAEVGGSFLFASEIKALLAHPEVERELDPVALDDYLTYLYVPAPRTIFRGIHELPPAHWLEWQDGNARRECYWDVCFQTQRHSFQESVLEAREKLDESVRARLVSDVPLGVFLSGGLDSSTVAYLMARHSSEPVRAFTLGFSEGAHLYNEWQFAREVSDAIGADARELVIPPPSTALLETVTRYFDEPFGNPTNLLLYQLSEAARRYVTVALVGDAGDEVFLGYPRYQGAVLAQGYRAAPLMLRQALGRCASLLTEPGNGSHFTRRLREFLTGATQPPEEMYLDWISYFNRPLRRRLYTSDAQRELGDYDSSQFLLRLFSRSASKDLLDRISYVDLHSYLPYNILRYSDRMSMAHGLEIRCPYTDHRLVEFIAGLPWQYKLHRTETKVLLRNAAKPWLPKSVFRRSKMGLNPPMGLWLREHLKPSLGEYLSTECVRRRGYFRTETIEELVRDHLNGRRDYSLHLWALISFEAWHRQYLDSRPDPSLSLTSASACPSSRLP
ncbi:MAG: asparagine synthase (glutamine-hydrolyzing) [Acidobacteria bacterium]|nr:MAG: asparagine synthase (glutamine-hydrolyzing) [Acidobacteriota bacterium]